MSKIVGMETAQAVQKRLRTVLFINKNAELGAEDRTVLEELGYVVVEINGDPSQALQTQQIYQGA